MRVAAAVILDSARARVLVARRNPGQHQGGLWEYPGGKCEAGEDQLAALERELHEELGITVQAATHLLDVDHAYIDKRVNLHFFVVDAFTGEPSGREGQEIRWVDLADLPTLAFPEANEPVARALNEWLRQNQM